MESGTPIAPATSLAGRAMRAGAWTLASYGGSQALRLISNLILTRLLMREAFGLMALVSVFLTGLSFFSDIGAGPTIIQSQRGEDQHFLDTVWTIQVLRGFVLWLVTCACTIPFAHFYDSQELLAILPLAGTNAIFAGFNSTKLFSMNRQLNMGRLAMVELSSQALGITAMVIWAFISPTVWALVFGGSVTTAAKMVFSHVLLPGKNNRWCWDVPLAREVLQFGRWIFLSTMLTFLSNQTDRLIFGKLVSLATLGVYNIGLMLATLPSVALSRVSQAVVFPVFSRAFEREEDPTASFLRVRRPLLIMGGFAVSILAGAGPAIISVLYDERYADAGWMVRILSFGAWFSVLESTVSSALMARGLPRWLAFGNATKLAAISVLIPIGHALGGFPGALMGFVAADMLRLSVVSTGAIRIGIRGWRQDLALTGLVALSAASGFGISSLTEGWLGHDWHMRIVEGLIIVTAVAALWLPVGIRYYKDRRAQQQAGAGRAAPAVS